MSLVVCEFHEVDGAVMCDVVCSHCGGVAVHRAERAFVTALVYAGAVPICDDCEATKCKMCGVFPQDAEGAPQWYNGVCWECRDLYYEGLLQSTRSLLAISE